MHNKKKRKKKTCNYRVQQDKKCIQNNIKLPLYLFTAYSKARCWLRIAITAYPTCIRRPC